MRPCRHCGHRFGWRQAADYPPHCPTCSCPRALPLNYQPEDVEPRPMPVYSSVVMVIDGVRLVIAPE